MATTWLLQTDSIRLPFSSPVAGYPMYSVRFLRVDTHIIAYCIGFVAGNLQMYFMRHHSLALAATAIFLTLFDGIK